MGEKVLYLQKVPNSVPRIHIIQSTSLNYTEAKLYIPKKNKYGRKVPDLSKPWYVWYRFKNPETGKYDNKSKFIVKLGINKYKTVSARKAFGKNLIIVINQLLKEGMNPYTKTVPDSVYIPVEPKEYLVRTALLKALEAKRNNWANSTARGIEFRINKFIEFAESKHIAGIYIQDLKRNHIVSFLNYINTKESATSVNNYRSALSAIFTQLVHMGILEYNLIKDIPKLKSKPVKNHPFTSKQIQDIKKYLIENDPYLLKYCQFLAFSFLRNREILRIRIKDVDLENKIITVKTKTKKLEKVYIIDKLENILLDMNLSSFNENSFLFTNQNSPGIWDVNEKSKLDHFGHRFKKVKKKFGFGKEFGIYSFRHSIALNVFENLLEEGYSENEVLSKMLSITRHDSIAGLNNYLREKKKMLPKDYSHRITIDF